LLPDTAELGTLGLGVGGCDVAALAERYGTPLYIYDETTLRNSARRVRAAFEPLGARISFAAKACSTPGVLRVFEEEGLDLDAVSLGEMVASARAGFDPARIHLHGNCKSDEEIDYALHAGIRAIVVDNVEELGRIAALTRLHDREARVALRLCLSINAKTHPHLQTGGGHSKFGILRGSDEERAALAALTDEPRVQLVGLHTHIGSQIADAHLYREAATELLSAAGELRERGHVVEEVSVGGGWAVPYTADGPGLEPEEVATEIGAAFARAGAIRPAVEPGRMLVARAGLAIYRVGAVKTRGSTRLIAVDGGMGDNPRPALYDARYTAMLAERPLGDAAGPATVVGRYCESGDVLVENALLPPVACGDLICVPVSGAYQLTMASGYNLVPPPAAVMVCRGESKLLTRRGAIDDLLNRECT